MGKSNIEIKGLITQCVLIVFSVVLGLYLSERIEERKKRQDSEILLTKIKAEVKDNIDLMKVLIPYHQEVNKNLDSLSKDDLFITEFTKSKFIFFEKLLTMGNFIGRYPTKDAWDIAKTHPLMMNIEYDKLLALSRIYNQQEMTFEPLNEIIELFNSKDINRKNDAKLNLELISNRWHELVAREKQLMKYYKKAEETIDLKIAN